MEPDLWLAPPRPKKKNKKNHPTTSTESQNRVALRTNTDVFLTRFGKLEEKLLRKL
jgi:hypothetical protein